MELIDAINLKFGLFIVGVFVALPTFGWLSLFLYKRLGLPDPEYYKPGKKHH